MQTEKEVINAQTDLIGKVCQYLTRRLALYANNISNIDRDGRNHIKQEGHNHVKQENKTYQHHFVTSEGWSTLFNAEPLAHGRRVCSFLYDVFGSAKEFWRGCTEDDFIFLHTICHPTRNQPQNLLRKHFLFFQYLFAYLAYIESVVQRVTFSHFNEVEELRHFLNLLVATQFLLCDLLDMDTTPIGRRRTKFRENAELLYNSIHECIRFKESFHREWRNARGNLTTEFWYPHPACEHGQFYVLGMQRVSVRQGQIYRG